MLLSQARLGPAPCTAPLQLPVAPFLSCCFMVSAKDQMLVASDAGEMCHTGGFQYPADNG